MTPRIFAALLARLWRQHRLALAIITAGVAAFEFVITRIAPLPGQSGFIDGVIALLPPDISQMAYEQFQMGSAVGVLAFGYLHPFFLALCSAWVIRVGAGALAGEIGRGTMEILASRPVPRWTLVAAAAMAIGVGLAVIAAAAFAASAFGVRLRPELEVPSEEMWRVPFMAWMLFMAWGSVTLAVSATRREAGTTIAWVSGLIVTAFVVEFLGRVWTPVSWAKPLSLFAYYHPQYTIFNPLKLFEPLVLGAVAVAGIALAVMLIQRRDL